MSFWRRLFRKGVLAAPDADAAMRAALRSVLDDDLDAAEEVLSRVVRSDSDEIDAYMALARLYRRRGETGRAIRLHQNLLLRRDLPRDVRDRALEGLAGDFRQGGFLQRSIAAYEEVLEHRPRSASALSALARLQADVRQFPRAIELVRRLARQEGRDPRSTEATLLVESAAAAAAEGRVDDARKTLRRALRRDAQLPRAWVELGGLEAERGNAKKALAAWRKVPELDRRCAEEVYPRLEATYVALGKGGEYEAFLQKILDQHPGDVGARLALAQAFSARGEAERAIAEVRALLERDSENLRAHAALGRVLLAAGHEGEAVKALAELLNVMDRRGLLDSRERIT